jgi:hypothetical protein
MRSLCPFCDSDESFATFSGWFAHVLLAHPAVATAGASVNPGGPGAPAARELR